MPANSSATRSTTPPARVSRSVLLALTLLVGVLTLWVQPAAFACSCALAPPEQVAETSAAAFVGTLLEVGPQVTEFGERDWRFEVEAVIAGDLEEVVDVRAPEGDGGNCGWNIVQGERVGVALFPTDTGWGSNGCAQYDPDVLLKVSKPRQPLPVASPAPSLLARTGAWRPSLGMVAGGLTLAAVGVVGSVTIGQRRRD